jgi:hypothetical protein
MLRGLVYLVQNTRPPFRLRLLRAPGGRYYATSTRNPYEKLVRKLKVGSHEYRYFSLLDLKDSRLGKVFKFTEVSVVFAHFLSLFYSFNLLSQFYYISLFYMAKRACPIVFGSYWSPQFETATT